MTPTLGKTLDGKALAIDVERLIESRLLVQGTSGAGKTVAVKRLLEQTHGKLQHIVIDTEDEYPPLAEKFDYVLAGPGRMCPLESRSVRLFARKLLETGSSAILDIHDIKPHERGAVVRGLIESLMDAPKNLCRDILVVVEECHLWAPQTGSESEATNAVVDLAMRGRKRGFCLVAVTPRISDLKKSVVAQCTNRLIGLTTLDMDVKRAAYELGFSGKEDVARLTKLEWREFFAFGPALSKSVQQFRIDDISTEHGRRRGKISAPPPPRSAVKAILSAFADLPKEAEEEARTLADAKAVIAGLRRELTVAKKGQPKADAAAIETAIARERAAFDRSQSKLVADLNARGARVLGAIENLSAIARKAFDGVEVPKAAPVSAAHVAMCLRGAAPAGTTVRQAPPRPRREPVEASGELPRGERAVLIAIAQQEDHGATREQLTILTGYKRSTRDTYLQRLGEKRYVAPGGREFVATDEGVAALGDYERLPTGAALLEHHLRELPEGERKVLEAVVAAHPEAIDREAIGEATGYARSSRDTYLQRLGARRLVETSGRGAVRASPMLFD